MKSQSHWYQLRQLCCGAAVVLIGSMVANLAGAQEAATPPPPTAAPDYEFIAIPEAILLKGNPTQATRDLERQVKDILRGDKPVSGNEAVFDNFFVRYVFARMTLLSEEELASLPSKRDRLFRDYIRPPTTIEPKAHERLVDLTFRTMKDYVSKNYHPAVRYNAMLIIGDLNSREASTSTVSPSPPEPLAPSARDFMLAEAVNPKQLDSVRLAALLGLMRHMELNAQRPANLQIAKVTRDGITKQLLPLALDKTVPSSRSPEGHAWLRGRVLEVLAAAAQAGPDDAITQAIAGIVADPQEPTSLRMIAATALGRLNLASSTTVNGTQLARNMADLLIAASREQLAALDAEIAKEKERLRKQGYLGPGQALPYVNPNDPIEMRKAERMDLTQRILKYNAHLVTLGLRGADGNAGVVSATKEGPARNYVTNLQKSIADLVKVSDLQQANGRPAPIEEIAKELRAGIGRLEQIARTAGGPAVPPPVTTPTGPAVPGGPDLPGGPGGPDLPGDPTVPSPPDVPAPPVAAPAPPDVPDVPM
jgi:hypothetical protein